MPPFDNIALTINNLTASGYTIQKVFGNATIFVSGNAVSFSLGEYSQTYPNDGTITLSTTASTPCGNISQAFTFTTQGQCGNCFGAYYSVSPNPATGNVKVKANKEDKKAASENNIYRIGIYDQYGTLLKSYNYNGVEEATLNVSGIKPGLYILRVFDGKTEHSERLSIAR